MMPLSHSVINVRTIVDLPELERDRLDARCRQRGISRAEAIREALRLWLKQQQPQHRQVFALWQDRADDSLTMQDALRREWAER